MDNKFDIFKMDFISHATDSNIPFTESDIKIFKEQEDYQATNNRKGRVICCCPNTAYKLKKLYHFRDFVTESDFNIFKQSLIEHPFGNKFKTKSNEDPTRKDLLEAISKIKDWVEYMGHIDVKNYFFKLYGNRLNNSG
jgi:hypothetical protein